jgi:hypothetical protein
MAKIHLDDKNFKHPQIKIVNIPKAMRNRTYFRISLLVNITLIAYIAIKVFKVISL